ncbi:MAG: hypothetical protein IPM56_05505 [Ignavibacteriales bacterium]|nr:MAG: hypothetical protein IPM56_05505 [Ignavibacteriales bacterium]
MEVITKKKGGVSHGLILLFGLTILIASILIYLFILKGVYGRFSANELIPDTAVLKNALFGEKPKIAVLYSRYTENMLPAGSTWLNDNIITWRKFLNNTRYDYDVISDTDLETGDISHYSLLVLPGSKSLSDREIIRIKKFIDAGGSIFATSGIASYSNDGKWRGWEFLSEIFGIKYSKEISNDAATKIHTLRGGLNLTANIPTGFPLRVATWDLPIAAEVLDPRSTQVSFWYNYKLEGGLSREEIKHSAGIVSGTYGSGRFVWMGFEINSVIGVQEDYVYFDRLFNNSINWLTYQPIAYIKDWPADFKSAAMITPMTGSDLQNTENLLEVLSSEKVKASFIVDPSLLAVQQKLNINLKAYGDISALVDIGYRPTVTDTSYKLNSLQLQQQKLKSAQSSLENYFKTEVNGFLPYYGTYDNNTIQAAVNNNYQFIFVDSLTDRSVPKTLLADGKRIIVFTKTARDDYEVIRDYGLTEKEFQFYTYQEDIDRVLFEGGLYIFKPHSEYQCRPENVEVIRDVIKELKRKNFWIATASEIGNWYKSKDRVELRVDKRGKTRVVLNVSNSGSETLNDLVVEVDLNDNAEQISLDAEIIGTKPAKLKHSPGSRIIQLYVDELKPDESRTYYIDYNKPNV